jgi:hypothetical protein
LAVTLPPIPDHSAGAKLVSPNSTNKFHEAIVANQQHASAPSQQQASLINAASNTNASKNNGGAASHPPQALKNLLPPSVVPTAAGNSPVQLMHHQTIVNHVESLSQSGGLKTLNGSGMSAKSPTTPSHGQEMLHSNGNHSLTSLRLSAGHANGAHPHAMGQSNLSSSSHQQQQHAQYQQLQQYGGGRSGMSQVQGNGQANDFAMSHYQHQPMGPEAYLDPSMSMQQQRGSLSSQQQQYIQYLQQSTQSNHLQHSQQQQISPSGQSYHSMHLLNNNSNQRHSSSSSQMRNSDGSSSGMDVETNSQQKQQEQYQLQQMNSGTPSLVPRHLV